MAVMRASGVGWCRKGEDIVESEFFVNRASRRDSTIAVTDEQVESLGPLKVECMVSVFRHN